MMNLKYLLFLMIFILCVKNYYFVNEYINLYLLTNKNKNQIDEKSTCFHYYNQHVYDKNLDVKCIGHSHQYVLFVLDRAQYIHNYVTFNAILICIISIIIIYQNCLL